MSNTLKQIVKNIQFVKGWSIEQVAQSIGYSRVHLNKAMNSTEGNGELEELLRVKHGEILQNVSAGKEVKGGGSLSLGDLATLQVRSEARLTVLLEAVAEVLAGQRGLTAADVRLSLESAVKAKEADLKVELGKK